MRFCLLKGSAENSINIEEWSVYKMNQDQLKNAGIEAKSGIQRFMGNEDLYIKYLYRFLEDENYKNLQKALENGNIKDAFFAAHTLKGVCGNLSLIKMESILKIMVEELRQGNLQQAEDKMPELEDAYVQIQEVLK